MEASVIAVLKHHPELIRDAIAELERRDDAARRASAKTQIKTHSQAIYDTAGSTVLGNPKGDVTVVVFLDYHCPYCRRLDQVLKSTLDKDKNVRVLVKQLPILGPGSKSAALLMLSNGQNHNTLALHQALMTASTLDDAEMAHLRKQFSLPAEPPTGAEAALDGVRILSGQLGIQGTPAVIVGDTLWPGAVDENALVNLIAAARLAQTAKIAAR